MSNVKKITKKVEKNKVKKVFKNNSVKVKKKFKKVKNIVKKISNSLYFSFFVLFYYYLIYSNKTLFLFYPPTPTNEEWGSKWCVY